MYSSLLIEKNEQQMLASEAIGRKWKKPIEHEIHHCDTERNVY